MVKRILLLSFLLTGCASSVTYKDLLFSDSYDLQPRARLSEKQMRHDTDVLIYALENAYGGRKYVDQNKFSEALKNLKDLKLDGVDSRTFCVALSGITAEIPDNHLIVRLESSRCGGHSFPKAGVGHNIAVQKKIPWELNFKRAGKAKIPVLSITSLLPYEDKAWDHFEDTVKKLRESKKAIIIDIRGNQGGDDSRGHQLASYLYGQDFESVSVSRVISQTPATFAMRASNDKLKMFQYRKQNESIPDFLQKHYDDEMVKLSKSLSGNLPAEQTSLLSKGNPFNARKAYTKPIYLLIDRECVSSCESIIEAFEHHPYAITVGENSGGFIHFGNVAKFILPESQIQVQMASDFWKYTDGRYKETIGYEPKVRVKPGEDALAKALSLIKNKFP